MICPTCGRPGLEFRYGVCFPPLKARIIDAIKAAGDGGLTSEEVIQIVYEKGKECNPDAIKTHVFQINEMLAETDFCIVAEREIGWTSYWVLSRMKAGGPAPARFRYSASWRNVKRKKQMKLLERREKEEDHGKRDQDDRT